MPNTVLVIGPSGVGKSTAINYCRDNNLLPGVEILDLDYLVHKNENMEAREVLRLRGEDGFLQISIAAITRYAGEREKQYLIAVGAGTLQSQNAIEFIKSYNSVLITANEDECYSRIVSARGNKRIKTDYINCEFSPLRKTIYGSANVSIDTTNMEEINTAKLLATKCKTLLEQ